MYGMRSLLIEEDNASHAIECAKYLAKLAKKWIDVQPEGMSDGDKLDIENNLKDIILVLEGNEPTRGA